MPLQMLKEEGKLMAKILIETSVTTAIKLFDWRELVEQMERQNKKALDKAIKEVEENIPDWELQVLKKYLELSDTDLII